MLGDWNDLPGKVLLKMMAEGHAIKEVEHRFF